MQQDGEILRDEKRCFRSLRNSDISKNQRASYKCCVCQGRSHHTSIWENKTEAGYDKEKIVMLANTETDILLQTANCLIGYPKETKSREIKLLLNSRSQKTTARRS